MNKLRKKILNKNYLILLKLNYENNYMFIYSKQR